MYTFYFDCVLGYGHDFCVIIVIVSNKISVDKI